MRVLLGRAGDWPVQRHPSALAVGVFDGIHAGHRAVLGALGAAASRSGLLPGVVTFDPHPLTVVAPERAPAMLTGIGHRIELLADFGVELVAVVGFDEATRNWTPEHFAVDLLAGTLAARVVLAGEDFRFGRDRAGDVAGLRRMGEPAGFETVVVPLVEGGRSSSSVLRAMIASGDLAGASAELGRPHEVRGVVRRHPTGCHMVLPAGMALPPPGGYAVTVGRHGSESIPAQALIASDLTVRTLEGVDDDLDGWLLRVRFVAPVPESADDAAVRTALGHRGD
jgi:riboflavin kinase/FMN adenylyltransferase